MRRLGGVVYFCSWAKGSKVTERGCQTRWGDDRRRFSRKKNSPKGALDAFKTLSRAVRFVPYWMRHWWGAFWQLYGNTSRPMLNFGYEAVFICTRIVTRTQGEQPFTSTTATSKDSKRHQRTHFIWSSRAAEFNSINSDSPLLCRGPDIPWSNRTSN